MNMIAQLNLGGYGPGWKIGVVAVALLAAAGIYAFVRWLLNGPRPADPWDEEVARAVESDEAMPLCHRCLTPQSPAGDFCPHCGATVGKYTNWLPYPYIFSLGDMLRLGVAGQFRRTWFTLTGFILLSLAVYQFFAPLYWGLLIHHRSERPPPLPGRPAATQ